MKRYILVLIAVSCAVTLFADWSWARSIGFEGMERIWDMASDPEDNIFIVGELSDSLSLDDISLEGSGLSDSFILKLNSGGEALWGVCLSSTEEDVALGVGTDAQGNSYVCGYFIGTMNCQGSLVNSSGLWDAYVAKFSPNGQLLWLNSFGGILNDIAYGIDVNSAGLVSVTGWFADQIGFGDGHLLISAGGSDIFTLACSSNGALLWAERAGTIGVDYAYKVANDETGNTYITGSAGIGAEFGEYILSSSGMYIAKYNSEGQIQWLNGSNNVAVICIEAQAGTSPGQRGLVSGRLPGAGSIGEFSFETNNLSNDAYWAEFDLADGEWMHLEFFGGPGADKSRDASFENYPIMVGSFEESLQIGDHTYTSLGSEDAFLYYRLGGQPVFVTAGGLDNESPSAVAQLESGEIVVAGWHFGQSRFGSHLIDSSNSSNQNGFVALYSPQPSGTDEQVILQPEVRLFPNPCGDRLCIELKDNTIGSSAGIYNLRGQLIHTFPSQDIQRGYLEWNGTDLKGAKSSSGIYYMKLGDSIFRFLKL